MLNIQPLIERTSGKFIEVAGGPLYQCVDLVNYWLLMQGHTAILWRNAIDFRTAPGYKFVPNTPDFIPEEGDIAIFDIGKFGDVAVVAPGTTVNDLVVYGQNYPVGAPCRIRTHRGYGGMINNRGGFLVLSEGYNPPAVVPGTVTAKPGDSLSSIGSRSGVSLARMKELNPEVKAPAFVIQVGQKIRVS